MIPACGPPSSLSPLKQTRSTPAAIDACTVGSPARSSTRQPLPMSSTTGTFIDRAAAIKSSSDGRSVNPSIRKLDGCTRRNMAVAGRDRRHVIVDARAVGGAHLAQHRSGLPHHVGHAEAAADLHQLAARNDHLPAAREAGQDQQCRGGVVVDHDGRFGAGERGEQRFGVDRARAAFAAGHVVFQVRVALRDRGHALDGGVGNRRAAKVGVNHHARWR